MKSERTSAAKAAPPAMVHDYLAQGWSLVPLLPGEKRPSQEGWNKAHRLVRTREEAASVFTQPGMGVGVHLASSGLCSIDLDALADAGRALRAVGISADAVIGAGWQVVSGKPDKARSMFTAPKGVPLQHRRLRVPLPRSEWPEGRPRFRVILELRGGSSHLQDVLPPSIHPDTGLPYAAPRPPQPLPELPAQVCDLWARWDALAPAMLEALGVETALMPLCAVHDSGKELRHPSVARSAYNTETDVTTLLIAHGYTQHGDRFAHAGASGTAGVRRIPGKKDLWQSDNFGDPLCGTFDAWTAHVILDYSGNGESATAQWVSNAAERARAKFNVVPRAEAFASSGGEACLPYSALAAGRESPELFRRIAGWKPRDWTKLRERPEPDYYVDGLILSRVAGGIVSKGGLGKTTLLMTLGIATALGGEWLGMKVKMGPFVLLSLDDPQEDLDTAFAEVVRETFPFGDEKAERAIAERVRLISLRDMAGDISFAGTDQSGAWVASRVENVVIEALRDVKDIRCVAFDTARQYAGGTTNDDRVMTIMTKAVTRVADELRCACLVTHHMTKEGARAGIADQYSGSGSGAFGDNLRFLLNLVPATFEDVSKALHLSDDDLRTLPRQQLLKVVDARGSLVRRALPDIYIARKGSQFRRIVADRKTEEERNKERVLEMLRAVEGGADTATRVGSSLKRSKTDALALVRECIDEGLIRRLRGERSPLMLTEAGKSKLAESGGESQ